MFAKWVDVNLGKDFRVSVFVSCTPDTPYDELISRAREMVLYRLNNKAEICPDCMATPLTPNGICTVCSEKVKA